MTAHTFVLVHGAWHGGWCWQRVADRLRAHGHIVFTPTLTGLGERAHLLHRGVNWSLHVADVLGVIKFERLRDIVLVGHSYGGCVISGVAEAKPEAIRAIVFLDAFIPDDGDALLDLVQPAVQEVIKAALERGDAVVPVRDAAAFKVNEKDRAWVDSLAVPQPIGTMTEKIKLAGAREHIPKRIYIRATGYPNVSFDRAYARVKADRAWRTYEVACGHDVMIDEPERLAEILLEVA
ncbi:MAG TPA: alpha/beta hydrolase [Pseudolabrys sp.]|jgi:pimeloyl-ACP methyl ester carboxylesterase|nr:alpha/beta hydrolase [Pseudolabrys sp.]